MLLCRLLCIHLGSGAVLGDFFQRGQRKRKCRDAPHLCRPAPTMAGAPDRREVVRTRARVLAARAAAAPLPLLKAARIVVALIVVSENDLMEVVDRRLRQAKAVGAGQAAVIFVADRHDHALNTTLFGERLRFVENADMAAVAGADVSEYATEAPRLREIATCGDIRIRSPRCKHMMPRRYWRDLVTATFWVALRSAPQAEYVLRVEPDAILCLDSLVAALAAVPTATPFVLGLRRYCHFDDTFSLVSRPLADAMVFEWPYLRDFARRTTKYTMYGMVWPALAYWLARVRGFESLLLASNPDLKTLIESEKLERYVAIREPIYHHHAHKTSLSAQKYREDYEQKSKTGFWDRGVHFQPNTGAWSVYYRDIKTGRNVTLHLSENRERFAKIEVLKKKLPSPPPQERCLAHWYLHMYKVATDMDASWTEFTLMDGARPATAWAPFWEAALRFPLGACFSSQFIIPPGSNAWLNASAMAFPPRVATTRRFPDTAATTEGGALARFDEAVD